MLHMCIKMHRVVENNTQIFSYKCIKNLNVKIPFRQNLNIVNSFTHFKFLVQKTLRLAAHTRRTLTTHLVGSHETLDGHLHCLWDTWESPVFNFNYIGYSCMPLSFTHLSSVGRLASKVSSKCFITEFSKSSEFSIKLMGLSHLINMYNYSIEKKWLNKLLLCGIKTCYSHFAGCQRWSQYGGYNLHY